MCSATAVHSVTERPINTKFPLPQSTAIRETHMVTSTDQVHSLEVRHAIPAALPTATEMLHLLHNSEGDNKVSINFVADCSRKLLGTAVHGEFFVQLYMVSSLCRCTW